LKDLFSEKKTSNFRLFNQTKTKNDMSGFFGCISKTDSVTDVFYGTDYHSHLGTMRGGMSVRKEDGSGYSRHIHDISNSQFRSKLEDNLPTMKGKTGIGVISDYEDQPLVISSHLGVYSIVTVGVIKNADSLIKEAFKKKKGAFAEISHGEVNPTAIVAHLIDRGSSFETGIKRAQDAIEGSCSMLLLTDKGIYAARDKFGRTPIVLGKKKGAWAATSETCAFPNLGYERVRDLGPGEIVRISAKGVEVRVAARKKMRMCSFLWVYYGYPASDYEGINVEDVRNKCGACLARRDNVTPDVVAGIPDSGTGHAIGYANQAGIPYRRPFVKYTPTWPRSFMPQVQSVRELVARMKLIPVKELIRGQRLLFCEDSIVRGTQLRDTVKRLYDAGAKEIHMRPACPPLVYGCKYLNFSRSRSEMELAGRWAIKELEPTGRPDLKAYANPDSKKYQAMVEVIRKRLKLTSLRYQRLDDLVESIGLPKEKLCTYCWDGVG
jgi:amidophosphoribosyltransferase